MMDKTVEWFLAYLSALIVVMAIILAVITPVAIIATCLEMWGYLS